MNKFQWLKTSLFISFYCLLFTEVAADEGIDAASQGYFPLWAELAKEHDQPLPKPYGLSMNYLTMSQALMIDNISFSGLAGLEPLITVESSDAQQDTDTLSLKADLWLFPFLNVYGLLGHTQGRSISDVQVMLNGLSMLDPVRVDLEFKGLTYGAGGTLVADKGDWFSLLDINYSHTDLDILGGEVRTLVISPRLGYRWEVSGHRLQLWSGMMYQQLQQRFHGELSEIGLSLPSPIPANGRFKVEQKLKSQWNLLFGAQASLTKQVAALLEVGVGKRNSLMLNLGYRF